MQRGKNKDKLALQKYYNEKLEFNQLQSWKSDTCSVTENEQYMLQLMYNKININKTLTSSTVSAEQSTHSVHDEWWMLFVPSLCIYTCTEYSSLCTNKTTTLPLIILKTSGVCKLYDPNKNVCWQKINRPNLEQKYALSLDSSSGCINRCSAISTLPTC